MKSYQYRIVSVAAVLFIFAGCTKLHEDLGHDFTLVPPEVQLKLQDY